MRNFFGFLAAPLTDAHDFLKMKFTVKYIEYENYREMGNFLEKFNPKDFQLSGILTSVDSDEPLQTSFKLRNSK